MIAVQLYTVRAQLQDPSRLGGVLARLREIGYGAVEVAGLSDVTAGRFGEELRRADLVACAAHVALDRLKAELDAVVAECADWGCRYVVVPGLPRDYRSQDGYRRFAGEAAELARELRPSGLRKTPAETPDPLPGGAYVPSKFSCGSITQGKLVYPAFAGTFDPTSDEWAPPSVE